MLAALDNLPDFVARHSYSQGTGTMLQRPSAAAHTGHLESFTVQDAAFATQRRGPALWEQAVQAVTTLLQDLIQQLQETVMQEDVIVVLTAARAQCQHQAVFSAAGPEAQGVESHAAFSSEFLRALSSEELVQHAYAVKEGLQQLKPEHSTHGLLASVQQTLTGELCVAVHARCHIVLLCTLDAISCGCAS